MKVLFLICFLFLSSLGHSTLCQVCWVQDNSSASDLSIGQLVYLCIGSDHAFSRIETGEVRAGRNILFKVSLVDISEEDLSAMSEGAGCMEWRVDDVDDPSGVERIP